MGNRRSNDHWAIIDISHTQEGMSHGHKPAGLAEQRGQEVKEQESSQRGMGTWPSLPSESRVGWAELVSECMGVTGYLNLSRVSSEPSGSKAAC
jgi:hypothetical protein